MRGRNYRNGNRLGVKAAGSMLMRKLSTNQSSDSMPEYRDPRLLLEQRYGKATERLQEPEETAHGFLYEGLASQKHFLMEEFHYAGRAIDMTLVDARRVGSADTLGGPRFGSVYPGKLAQMAYYGALFDWCFFSRLGHVHCSVKPGKSTV